MRYLWRKKFVTVQSKEFSEVFTHIEKEVVVSKLTYPNVSFNMAKSQPRKVKKITG